MSDPQQQTKEAKEEKEERERIEKKVDALKNSKFKQQMLPAWRPVPTYHTTMAIFVVFGIVFLTLGIIMYVMSDKIQQVTLRYDDECAINTQCQLALTIDEDIDGPLYVYYELGNFYQNHRRYVKSRSYAQLMGDDIDSKQAEKDCTPIVTNSDMGVTTALDGSSPLAPDDIAIPCGLIAKSLFTDKYAIYSTKSDANTAITINSDSIAWKSDVEFKFKNQDGNWQAKQWHDIEDQHFIVWMRTAGLPQFRKLYGELTNGLKKGTYWLNIANNYPVSKFDGTKTFILSTTNVLGGQNYFLAVAYIVVGVLCLVLAFIFAAVWLSKRRNENRQN